MALIEYRLGDLLELSEETNKEGNYTADDVRGMTITKEIIPTRADVTNTDLSKFLVVNPGEFIFNPRTHGKKIGFGYNNFNHSFIISWNNIAFRIKESMRNVVLSEYLFFHFNRSEWDREACFRSWGSSTEVFSWNALCEMKLYLPSISVQQKYVDIYNALIENQKSFERGLDDLKLVCDAVLDRYKHSENKVKIRELLEEVDSRNNELIHGIAYGVNISKQFMISNSSSDDLRKYKIVEKNQFVFSGMQTGRDECIRIALQKEETPIIVSPAYSVLRCTSTSVIPEYIQLWFSRHEIDRLGWFLSDASIRTNLDMDSFYSIEIPLPSIEQQQSVVDIYSVLIERRRLNEQLKAQLKDICPVLIKGSLEEGKLD